MDRIDEVLLLELAHGIPLVAQPFSDIAVKLGISSDEVLTRVAKLKQSGIIRRFGAVVTPNNIGFGANAVIAWKIPKDRVSEVGQYLSTFREVTHCYERVPIQGRWEYNLYIVLHAPERQTIEDLTKLLAETIGIQDYIILYSKRNLKNTVKEE